jgi:hypothetical protein
MGTGPDFMHDTMRLSGIKGAYTLTNEIHIAKLKAGDVITEICNVLWEHESCWN